MLHNPTKIRILHTLILLACLLLHVHSNFILMSVTANNLQINTPSNYTFTLNRQYDPVNFAVISNPLIVTLNSTIAITFPSQFLTISNSSSVPCTDSNGNDLGCTLNSAARKVTIGSYYSTSATLSNTIITIIMPNIINAYKAGSSDNFFWEILYPNGSVIDQGPAATTNYVSTSLTFLPGTFKCKFGLTQPAPSQPMEPTSEVHLHSPSPCLPTTRSPQEDKSLSLFLPFGLVTRWVLLFYLPQRQVAVQFQDWAAAHWPAAMTRI